jgi:hypothetical protein
MAAASPHLIQPRIANDPGLFFARINAPFFAHRENRRHSETSTFALFAVLKKADSLPTDGC